MRRALNSRESRAPDRVASLSSNMPEDNRLNVIQCKGLDHVVLRVSNIDRSIAFYRDVLSCPVERRLDDFGLVQLRAGASLVDLVDIDSPLGRAGGDKPVRNAGNMDHFALALSNFDESSIRAHLAHFNIEADETQRLYGADGFGPSIYLRDPDGNRVELKGPSEPTEESGSHGV